MNPENGRCLSATYDADFDKHLISFDNDYRMVVRKEIKEYYTNEVAKTYLEEPHGKGNCIERGFHSFANLEDTLKIGADIPQLFDMVVIKCIIPKDSKCYEGSFWGMTSYCSESIILKEIINYETN